jgi:hypothetical protein
MCYLRSHWSGYISNVRLTRGPKKSRDICFCLETIGIGNSKVHMRHFSPLHIKNNINISRWVVNIDGHNQRRIDGSIPIVSIDTIDRYYWSCWPPIVSIHRSKIFSLRSIVSIIDHKILIRTMIIDPSVHIQPMVSIHRSKIGSPAHFSKWRKARKYSSIIGRGKYDGLKGLCQKICCIKTVKMKKAEVYSSVESCIEDED